VLLAARRVTIHRASLQTHLTVPLSGSVRVRNGPTTLCALAHAPISSALSRTDTALDPIEHLRQLGDPGHDGRKISSRNDMLAARYRHAVAHQRRRVDVLKTI
jgi:hypothetical protein